MSFTIKTAPEKQAQRNARAAEEYPDYSFRILNEDAGIVAVTHTDDPGRDYRCTEHGCSCPDAAKNPDLRCKHRGMVSLARVLGDLPPSRRDVIRARMALDFPE